MRRLLAVAGMLALLAGGAWAQDTANAPGAGAWGRLVAANDLDLEGKTPFHLAMSFQLYDMDGRRAKTGSFEVWWAAPGSERIVVACRGTE